MKEIVIVEALRSPIGTFGGAFKNLSSVELGQQVLRQLVVKSNIDVHDIDQVIIGSVLTAGKGQNVARQIALKAGLPHEVTALTVDMLCGSGLKSIQLAVQSLLLGDSEIVIAGGVESMSTATYVLDDYRFGHKIGHGKLVDTMLNDGLTDAFDHIHMGVTAENIAHQFDISRDAQDEFAVSSQQKAEKAQNENRFNDEIAPIKIQEGNHTKIVDVDEYPRHGTTNDDLAKLKPVFSKDISASVTAGNASGINDGVAMVVLMTREKANALGLKVLASIVSYADAGVDPKIMGTGPIPATLKALEKAKLTVEEIDLIESNEAFAVQALHVQNELKFNPEKVNVNGGAIALGHPIGASGARILVTLVHEMIKRQGKYGLATLCIGGGQGTAMIISAEGDESHE